MNLNYIQIIIFLSHFDHINILNFPQMTSGAPQKRKASGISAPMPPPIVIFDEDSWRFPEKSTSGRDEKPKSLRRKNRNSRKKKPSSTTPDPIELTADLSSESRPKRFGIGVPSRSLDEDGFSSPREKNSNAAINQLGTHVKIPSDKNISNFDTVVLSLVGDNDILEETTTTMTPETTTVTTDTTTVSTTEILTEAPTTTEPPVVITSRSTSTTSSGGVKEDCSNEKITSNPDQTEAPEPTDRPTRPTGVTCKNIKLVRHGAAIHPEVKTKLGSYRGSTWSVQLGDVLTFYGIPYAAPPIKDLRFQRPMPPESFYVPNMHFDAFKMKPPCISSQKHRTSVSVTSNQGRPFAPPITKPIGSEDCLYLNIWLPKIVALEDKNYLTRHMPVIVWIHGEGFFSGIGDPEGEEYKAIANFVAATQTIVVNMQYRMGIFGFFYLDHPQAPGNMGLTDQSQALQFIEENIDCFGGNPKTITIMGHNLGAAFVGFHLLSKISPSYFSRAVMLSGNPLQPHVFKKNVDAYLAGMNFSMKIGCVNSAQIDLIMDCLRKTDATTLWDAQMAYHAPTDSIHEPLEHPFVPTDDGAVLEDTPLKLLEVHNNNENVKGKVCPVMIGTVKNEGSIPLMDSVESVQGQHPTDISYDKFIRIIENLFDDHTKIEVSIILHSYKNWDDLEDGLANQLQISDAIADHYYICPARRFCDKWSARGLSVYNYFFTERPSPFNRSEWMGVVHGDDVDFFFGVPFLYPKKYKPEEVKLSTNMMKMLTNFVKTGVPTKQWERYGREKPRYFELNTGATNKSKLGWNKVGPRHQLCDIWNEILPSIREALPVTTLTADGRSELDCFGGGNLGGRSLIGGGKPRSTHRIDNNCVIQLHNCSNSNFAIYMNDASRSI